MQLIRGLHNLHHARRGGAVAIGNFDGVHRGHQAILREVDTLVTFEPLPAELFDPDGAPARLTPLRDKLALLRDAGLAQCLVARFDHDFAALSPAAFVQRILVDGLGAQSVHVGEDFRYGSKRAGDLTSLRASGNARGFTVRPVPDICLPDHHHAAGAGRRISSTWVRQALANGDCAQAGALLGRPYSISGRVRRGQGLAAQLDMRTANVRVAHRPAPALGVYAIRALLADGRRVPGVANLGVRPTVEAANFPGCWLESHLFDFSETLYGQRIEVELQAFLRPEARFDSLAQLKQQMHADAERARALLGSHTPAGRA